MKILYFDCTAGVSGDMVRGALEGLGIDGQTVDKETAQFDELLDGGDHDHHEGHGHDHDHGHEHHDDHDRHDHDHNGEHFHRPYAVIKDAIEASDLPRKVKNTMLSIYDVVAEAEAKVHGSTVEDVAFHEVGRTEAVKNIAAVALMIDLLSIEEVFCSVINDGHGFITCSHGVIPVPVPAVAAMRENSRLEFGEADVETELVTPSGLAMMIGLGARTSVQPKGEVIAESVGYGKRDTGLGGLKVSLIGIGGAE